MSDEEVTTADDTATAPVAPAEEETTEVVAEPAAPAEEVAA